MAMAAYISRTTRFSITHQTPIRFFTTSSSSSFRDLKSAIKSEQDPLKIANLFESSISIPTFRRYRPLFTLSVHKLSRSKRFDLIDGILTNSIANSPDTQLGSEGFWLRIVKLYSEAGMVENALQVLDKMLQRKKCSVTEKSLCGVLSVMIDNKIYDEKLSKTFEDFVKKSGVSPGVKSFNLILKGHVKAGRVDEAQALVNKMESGDVKPDIDSYNVLLGGYLESGKMSDFETVVKRINEKGLESNLVTYNHRILRYCKSRECVRAKKLLDGMIGEGVVNPDSASYNAIIFGFCRVGDFESAKLVLGHMASDGYVKAQSFGYYTLMKFMVEEGEFADALEIYNDIVDKRWVPPFEATKLLINGLVKDSKVNEAKEIVGSFKKQLRGSALESWGKIEAELSL